MDVLDFQGFLFRKAEVLSRTLGYAGIINGLCGSPLRILYRISVEKYRVGAAQSQTFVA